MLVVAVSGRQAVVLVTEVGRVDGCWLLGLCVGRCAAVS